MYEYHNNDTNKMPRTKAKNRCCPLVLDAFLFHKHKKCSRDTARHASRVEGRYLNRYSPVIKFNDDEIYEICSNMKNNFEKKLVPKVHQVTPVDVEALPTLVLPVATSREERNMIRDARRAEDVLKKTICDLQCDNDLLRYDVNLRKKKRKLQQDREEDEISMPPVATPPAAHDINFRFEEISKKKQSKKHTSVQWHLVIGLILSCKGLENLIKHLHFVQE